MSITTNINETIHLLDNWNSQVAEAATGATETINETIHLLDYCGQNVDGGIGDTMFINEEIHLKDAISRSLFDATSISINEEIHLKDGYTRNVEVGGIYQFIAEEIHLRDEYTFSIKQNYVYTYNKNISFGETKEPGFKEYSHRFRWTNYNGVAIPDLNYKDLKEPIVRIMPAPSFLQFEYANSFLLFTRNSINRFILTPDVETGQWRARTDNLIEEFKDLGLMAPKTLILAGDTLFGLSEKGVWKWNKKGMGLISDKKIALPDAGDYEYIAFYSSIRNQYILHRQESGGSIYQMTHGTKVKIPDTALGLRYSFDVVMVTDTKFVMTYYEDANNGFLVVGEISGDSITFGATAIIYPLADAKLKLIRMSDTKVLVTQDQAAGDRAIAVGTISGTTITSTGDITVTGGVSNSGYLVRFSDTRFVIFHNQQRYYTGTFDGNETITLDVESSNWVGANLLNMKTVPISDGKAFIMYAVVGGNVICRIITDNGDGTIAFGSALDTGIAFTATDKFDAVMSSDDTFYTVVSNDQDLVLLPLSLSDTTLTAGDKTTKTGWFDTPNNVYGVAIANKGTSGFWLIFTDNRNSGYPTAIWGTGSPTKMSLWGGSLEVINTAESRLVAAISVPGGKGLLLHGEGITTATYGYATIWGMQTAAIDSFVYQIDRDKWGKFLGIDVLDIPVILSGGSLDENYNLWLDSDRQLMKYPGTAYTAVEAFIRTKEFYIEKGAFQRWMVDFEGSGVDVETRVHKMVGGSKTSEEDIKYNVTPNKFRGISLDKQRGYEMSIKIIDADILKGLSFDSKKWGEN